MAKKIITEQRIEYCDECPHFIYNMAIKACVYLPNRSDGDPLEILDGLALHHPVLYIPKWCKLEDA